MREHYKKKGTGCFRTFHLRVFVVSQMRQSEVYCQFIQLNE